jgi:NSS family neurotransmitter:Na+ symporter
MSSVHPGLPPPGGMAGGFNYRINDIESNRPRWRGNFFFIMASLGSSIGIGNIWRFPAMTWKYGGEVFVAAYFGVMLLVGIPMLILEIALGQKL